MLREFDMYEACGEGFPEPTQYLRRMLSVMLVGGGAVEAWTYIYNWPVEKLARIEFGAVFAEVMIFTSPRSYGERSRRRRG